MTYFRSAGRQAKTRKNAERKYDMAQINHTIVMHILATVLLFS
jgi:hypothetical protein